MDYVYFDNGQLKEIKKGNAKFISAEIVDAHSIKYQINLATAIPPDQKIKLDLPKIEVLVRTNDNLKCYTYENHYTMSPESETVMNKRMTLCKDGKYTQEIIYDRFRQYKKKEKDPEFIYDKQDRLIERRSKEDVPYATSWNYKYSYCLLYTSPSPRDRTRSRMPSSA